MSELKISRENTPSRLFDNDLRYIKRKNREFGDSDTRFKDKSATVRHYVHLGITTEKRTETANTLDNRIIKSSQKEVVTESLIPLKSSIDALIDAMRNFDKKQDTHFLNATKQNDVMTRRLEALFHLSENNFQSLADNVFRAAAFAEEALRNLVILRSIQYVFLLGYKTGRIEPDEKINWEFVVKLVHNKARELSNAELENITGGNTESPQIEIFARDIFVAIRDARQLK